MTLYIRCDDAKLGRNVVLAQSWVKRAHEPLEKRRIGLALFLRIFPGEVVVRGWDATVPGHAQNFEIILSSSAALAHEPGCCS